MNHWVFSFYKMFTAHNMYFILMTLMLVTNNYGIPT